MPNEIDAARLRHKLAKDPEEIRKFLEALIDRSGIKVPDDYDVEAAFADVLAIGAVVHDPAVQGPIGRVALWLFRRLPAAATGDAPR